MPRKPRLDIPGFYHIINRGVARRNVFLNDADKEKFLELLCNAFQTYDVKLHAYCLMNNHYHLLVEIAGPSLALAMRQVNSMYAVYFNKRYQRTGHLWQGRYKSRYVYDETYLFTLLRYIESNPVEAGAAERPGEYPFSSLAVFLKRVKPVACLGSLVPERFPGEALARFFETPLNDEEKEALSRMERQKVELDEARVPRLDREQPLDSYFWEGMSKEERNRGIALAFGDGYRQGEIARELGVTQPLVSTVLKKMK